MKKGAENKAPFLLSMVFFEDYLSAMQDHEPYMLIL